MQVKSNSFSEAVKQAKQIMYYLPRTNWYPYEKKKPIFDKKGRRIK